MQSLSYGWLYQEVQQYAKSETKSSPSVWEKALLGFGLLMAGIGVVVGGLMTSIYIEHATLILRSCLYAELAGFAGFLILAIKRELPHFSRPRETHASEMDVSYRQWQELLLRLRAFPTAERKTRLEFAFRLRDSMVERMSLLSGGLQRLGVLPMLVALYFQFRNWEWGDWAGAFGNNVIAGLLLWLIGLLYAASWLLIGIRLRLDFYVRLLESSLKDDHNPQVNMVPKRGL